MKRIEKMKPESSNKYEEIDPPYLPNKLLNKDSSKTIKINKPKKQNMIIQDQDFWITWVMFYVVAVMF